MRRRLAAWAWWHLGELVLAAAAAAVSVPIAIVLMSLPPSRAQVGASSQLSIPRVPTSRTSSFCSGTATSSVTLFMVLWPSGACTNITEGVTTELLVSSAGSIRNLRVKAGTAGFAAGSGVVTIRINGVNSAVTCTVGTGTTCADAVNTAAVVAGDRITSQVVTVATETLANVQVAVEY